MSDRKVWSQVRAFRACLSLIFILGLTASHVQADDIDLEHPPGRMIDIGSHRMHLYCIGENGPTVVIDAGLGGFSLEWMEVQQNLATQMRVCTYDRAGYGWSEPGPFPRTTAQIVEELYWLLDLAGEEGPYILVGHSFGGYTMQRFAALDPQLTSAVVLVDSSHPEQHVSFPVLANTVSRTSDIPPQQARLMRRRIAISSLTVLPENYPEDVAATAIQLLSFSKSMRAQQQELQFFTQSAHDVLSAGRLPDVDLIILTRGVKPWPENSEGRQKEKIWQALQESFLRKSGHARQIIASQSGHHIHLDEPELFEQVIRRLVADECSVEPLAQLTEDSQSSDC